MAFATRSRLPPPANSLYRSIRIPSAPRARHDLLRSPPPAAENFQPLCEGNYFYISCSRQGCRGRRQSKINRLLFAERPAANVSTDRPGGALGFNTVSAESYSALLYE